MYLTVGCGGPLLACSAFSHASVVEGFTHTASDGQLQLSLGTALPPNLSMAPAICALRSGNRSAQGRGGATGHSERREDALLLLPL